MAEIDDWDTSAVNNNDAPPDGWPENMNYSEVNNTGRENMATLARWFQDTNGSLTSTGSASTYVLAANRQPTVYTQGLTFRFEANHDSTGASTLNVNGLGAKALVTSGSDPTVAFDILANDIIEVVYDGTDFVLQNISAHFRPNQTGIRVRGTLDNDPTTGGNQDVNVKYANADDQRAADVGFPFSDANLVVYNRVHGGNVSLVAEQTGGTQVTPVDADPDGAVTLQNNGTDTFRTGSNKAEVWDGSAWKEVSTTVASAGQRIVAVATSTESSSNQTLTASTALEVALTAGWWGIDMLILAHSTSATADIKFDFNYTGTLTSSSHAWLATNETGTTEDDAVDDITTDQTADVDNNNLAVIRLKGYVDVSNSGTLQFRFSRENVASAAIDVRAGSYLRAEYLAAT